MPACFWIEVPPPKGIFAPLQIAWPPMSASASITITEEPDSRATMAAGIPAAPAPITTTSASRSQRVGGVAACADAAVGAMRPPTAAAAPARPAFLIRSRRVRLDLAIVVSRNRSSTDRARPPPNPPSLLRSYGGLTSPRGGGGFWVRRRAVLISSVSFPGCINRFADGEVRVGAGAGFEFLHAAAVDFGDVEIAVLIDGKAVHAPEAAGEIAPDAPGINEMSLEIVFQHLRGAAVIGPERAVCADIDQMDVGRIRTEAPFA